MTRFGRTRAFVCMARKHLGSVVTVAFFGGGAVINHTVLAEWIITHAMNPSPGVEVGTTEVFAWFFGYMAMGVVAIALLALVQFAMDLLLSSYVNTYRECLDNVRGD